FCIVLTLCIHYCVFFFFFQAEDGIRDRNVTGVQTCALPIFHNSLTSIFNLANQKMTASQQIYLYFSLVHMPQNRFNGSSDNDEHLSHVMIKKLINRGGL